jgi:hypothetical protein
MPDDIEEARWLSYAELAEVRGIDVASAVRTVRNRRWLKRKGNDGKVRVAVPREFLEAKRPPAEEDTAEVTRKIAALETKVEMLTAEVQRERGRAEAAEMRNARLTAEMRELGEGKAGAEATAKARLEEVERLAGLLNAGLLTRLREFWQGRRGKGYSGC